MRRGDLPKLFSELLQGRKICWATGCAGGGGGRRMSRMISCIVSPPPLEARSTRAACLLNRDFVWGKLPSQPGWPRTTPAGSIRRIRWFHLKADRPGPFHSARHVEIKKIPKRSTGRAESNGYSGSEVTCRSRKNLERQSISTRFLSPPRPASTIPTHTIARNINMGPRRHRRAEDSSDDSPTHQRTPPCPPMPPRRFLYPEDLPLVVRLCPLVAIYSSLGIRDRASSAGPSSSRDR